MGRLFPDMAAACQHQLCCLAISDIIAVVFDSERGWIRSYPRVERPARRGRMAVSSCHHICACVGVGIHAALFDREEHHMRPLSDIWQFWALLSAAFAALTAIF